MGNTLPCCDDDSSAARPGPPANMKVTSKDGKTPSGSTLKDNTSIRTIAGKIPDLSASDAQRLKDRNQFPIVLVNILDYEKIILSLCEKGQTNIDAKQLNASIIKAPVLDNNAIDWGQWNNFLHQTYFSPQTDSFSVQKLILCGILLCAGSDEERAETLWRVITKHNPFSKKWYGPDVLELKKIKDQIDEKKKIAEQTEEKEKNTEQTKDKNIIEQTEENKKIAEQTEEKKKITEHTEEKNKITEQTEDKKITTQQELPEEIQTLSMTSQDQVKIIEDLIYIGLLSLKNQKPSFFDQNMRRFEDKNKTQLGDLCKQFLAQVEPKPLPVDPKVQKTEDVTQNISRKDWIKNVVTEANWVLKVDKIKEHIQDLHQKEMDNFRRDTKDQLVLAAGELAFGGLKPKSDEKLKTAETKDVQNVNSKDIAPPKKDETKQEVTTVKKIEASVIDAKANELANKSDKSEEY